MAGQGGLELCEFIGKIRVSSVVGACGRGRVTDRENLLTGLRETFLGYVVAVEKLILVVNHDIIHPHS